MQGPWHQCPSPGVGSLLFPFLSFSDTASCFEIMLGAKKISMNSMSKLWHQSINRDENSLTATDPWPVGFLHLPVLACPALGGAAHLPPGSWAVGQCGEPCEERAACKSQGTLTLGAADQTKRLRKGTGRAGPARAGPWAPLRIQSGLGEAGRQHSLRL